MPAIAAHHFFAHSVLKNLPSPINQRILEEKEAFHWGAQGPDILFYHIFPTGQSLNFGTLLHQQKIGPAFRYLTRMIFHLQDPILYSYLMGYVCHYCLDRQVHPYINNRCLQITHPKRDLQPNIQHRMLEADLDRAYIRLYAPDIPVRQFRLDSLNRPVFRIIHPIACLLTGLGRNLFSIYTTPARIEESMRLMNHLQEILFDPKGTKKQSLLRLESFAGYPDFFTALIIPDKPLEIDSLNLTHRPWIDQNGTLQTCDYWTLEQEAKNSASSLIPYLNTVLLGHTPFPAPFFERDYNGKPIL